MFFSFVFTILNIINIGVVCTSLCPILTLPQHGFFFSGYCERKVGSLCGLGCNPGYRLVDGDSFRECQEDKTWTGYQPKCEEIRCHSLKSNSDVIQECLPEQENSTDFKFGTKCRARCSENGYRLLGPHTRECLILGIWSGYTQFCIVNNETTTQVMTNTTSMTPLITTMTSYQDYSNYILSINQNDTGIILSSFQPFQFTIIFWFYLENTTNATLISLRKNNHEKVFEIVVRQSKLVFYHSSRNQTQPTLVKIPVSKWNHFAWTYSIKTKQSYLYIDGARQHSFDFRIVNFDFKSKLEIWNEIIAEQHLLVSYRDCRKQNGDIFSWSKIPENIEIDTKKLKSSLFCSGCSEPASIHGGRYQVSDYEIGSSVDYECNFGYELVGVSRAYCMVPSEWYPLPPICKYNPCTIKCELCDKKTGVCLRQQTQLSSDICDPECDDDEECIDGECTWTNTGSNWNAEKNDNSCNPPCPSGIQCINRQCEYNLAPYCPVSCRPGQVCIDGLCEHDRGCYEVCEIGERCYNSSCSCGLQGKCGKGELCVSDICMCGTRRNGCRPHEHCINGKCVCKTDFCDECGNTCKSNEICLDGKCVCNERCENVFCPFPCLNEGRCTGFYQCTCRQGWSGHRCEQWQRKNITIY
ncbi:unnamed protein product [Adineta steineri]|uniref:Uncharacterized protein n=1 Tax=Adineta steineri TaxID=433720 RepID=A0A814I1V3_9BILA|nr:unnamed protein product [Adineta steineri]CAF3634695.1 unnamed protein product [Adineta steineri]